MRRMIRVMRAASPVISRSVGQFQKLIQTALLAGAIAGTLLFIYQQLIVVPRILEAEVYEDRAEEVEHHEHSEWKPREGWERSLYTAASTMVTGIGFAALL